jgi:hypothetical protein
MKKHRRITKDDAVAGACTSAIGMALFLVLSALDSSLFPLIGFIGSLVSFHVFNFLYYNP